MIGTILLIGLSVFAFTQRTSVPTDVDFHFSNRYHHGAEDYKENCFKPKVFRGLLKFKVSCTNRFSFVAESDLTNDQINQYFERQIPLNFTRAWWFIENGRDLRDYKIRNGKNDPPIYVLKREQNYYPNCERLIFLTYSYKTGKVYFADPRKLYCTSKS